MIRRSAGLLFLAVALLAAVAVPRIAVPRIGGIAEIAPSAPGPPSAGDCLLKPAGWRGDEQPLYPPVATGTCPGPRFGEVVSVIPASKIQDGSRSATGGSITDPNMQACRNDAAHYLGITTTNDQFPLGGGWSPFPASNQILVAGPNAQQQAAGQHWLACIEYIDPEGPGAPRPGDYRRTAKNAFSTSFPPAAFATCLRTATMAQFEVVDCHQPHQRRNCFGMAFGPATTSMLTLTNTCNTLVSQYARIPPAAVAAQLVVIVSAFDTNGKKPSPPDAGTSQCTKQPAS